MGHRWWTGRSDVEYDYRVRAKNHAGYGPFAAIRSVSPLPPRDQVSCRQVTLRPVRRMSQAANVLSDHSAATSIAIPAATITPTTTATTTHAHLLIDAQPNDRGGYATDSREEPRTAVWVASPAVPEDDSTVEERLAIRLIREFEDLVEVNSAPTHEVSSVGQAV